MGELGTLVYFVIFVFFVDNCFSEFNAKRNEEFSTETA